MDSIHNLQDCKDIIELLDGLKLKGQMLPTIVLIPLKGTGFTCKVVFKSNNKYYSAGCDAGNNYYLNCHYGRLDIALENVAQYKVESFKTKIWSIFKKFIIDTCTPSKIS